MIPVVNDATPRQRLEAARFIQGLTMWGQLLFLTMLQLDIDAGSRIVLIVGAALFAAIAFWLFIYQRKMIAKLKAGQ